MNRSLAGLKNTWQLLDSHFPPTSRARLDEVTWTLPTASSSHLSEASVTHAASIPRESTHHSSVCRLNHHVWTSTIPNCCFGPHFLQWNPNVCWVNPNISWLRCLKSHILMLSEGQPPGRKVQYPKIKWQPFLCVKHIWLQWFDPERFLSPNDS